LLGLHRAAEEAAADPRAAPLNHNHARARVRRDEGEHPALDGLAEVEEAAVVAPPEHEHALDEEEGRRGEEQVAARLRDVVARANVGKQHVDDAGHGVERDEREHDHRRAQRGGRDDAAEAWVDERV